MKVPAEVAKGYAAAAVTRMKQGPGRFLLLGILAGAFIALAGVGSAVAAVSIPLASVAKLVTACIFPGGLAMVLLAGSELFTGNCLFLIPVLSREAKVWAMVKSWILVYIGNFIGAALVAALVVLGHTPDLFGGAYAEAIVATAASKAALSFGDAFVRGILCNFLVCIAVWIAFAADSVGGKIAGLFFPIMLFVVSGFEHSVANMYYLTAGLFAKASYGIDAAALTWGAALGGNLLPVTLGNIVGGCICVALPYWAVYCKGQKK